MAEKILVVDDEYLLLNMLVETLKSKGYETFCTSDGFKAMRMMAEVSRDLIIK
ncbi:MAG TPA: DNA-binding response regulator, partial [Dehalococcoidia bacterium]|nr:DNA-binding response regulator [Dehalococcoidia bacterium]